MNISLAPEVLFFWGSLPVTNTLIMTLFLSATIIGASLFFRRRITLVPGRAQAFVETIFEFLTGLVDDVMQDSALAKKTFPLIATIFIFVWLANLAEVIPGLGTIGFFETVHGETEILPLLRSVSADLNMTLALAMIAVVSIHAYGIRTLGVGKYLGKFLVSPFQKPYGIGTFVGILELVSEFSKILSFSFRLFGNIFAGEVLLLVMLWLAPYGVPVPFLAMELFVGVIQALVFAMLTAVFIKMATVHGH